MRYVWDEKKALRNLDRHKIAFEDAARIFERNTYERIDDRFDYGEERWYAIGEANGRILTVIYVDVDEQTRRIISAWKAERHEEKA